MVLLGHDVVCELAQLVDDVGADGGCDGKDALAEEVVGVRVGAVVDGVDVGAVAQQVDDVVDGGADEVAHGAAVKVLVERVKAASLGAGGDGHGVVVAVGAHARVAAAGAPVVLVEELLTVVVVDEEGALLVAHVLKVAKGAAAGEAHALDFEQVPLEAGAVVAKLGGVRPGSGDAGDGVFARVGERTAADGEESCGVV